MKNILTILFIAIFSSFAFAQSTIKTQDWFIADKMVDCTGVAQQKCLIVRDANSNDWKYFYDQIKGFKFRENYTQKIRVRITPKKNVPADASAFNYRLVRTLRRSKTDGLTLEEAQRGMGNQPLPSASLTKNKWTLIEINETKIEGKNPVLTFNEKNNSFGIRICNGIGGNYTLKGNELKFSKIISTMMACPEPLMGNEIKFNEAIKKVTRFEQTADSLIFLANDTPVLKFVSENQSSSPNVTFENTKWFLTDIGTKKIAPQEPFPYLQFDKEKMSVAGSGGCNRLFGSYKIENQSLSFGAIGMTKMACAGEKNQIERDFSQALGKVNRFELSGDTLSFFAGETLLLKFTSTEN